MCVGVCACVCICMCVYMYVCMCVCMYPCMDGCMFVFVCLFVCLSWCFNTGITLQPPQSQYGRIQYSLYGLVEHAGGMHGGHYVAYINARRPDSGEVHPSPQQDSASSPPLLLPQRTGDWYYMSGTHVRPATEGEVLKSQAYLLFYERMS